MNDNKEVARFKIHVFALICIREVTFPIIVK